MIRRMDGIPLQRLIRRTNCGNRKTKLKWQRCNSDHLGHRPRLGNARHEASCPLTVFLSQLPTLLTAPSFPLLHSLPTNFTLFLTPPPPPPQSLSLFLSAPFSSRCQFSVHRTLRLSNRFTIIIAANTSEILMSIKIQPTPPPPPIPTTPPNF